MIYTQNDSLAELIKKIEQEREIVNKGRKTNNNEKGNSDSVVKVEVVNRKEEMNNSKKCNSLKEEIDERLKSIKRSMIYTQDNGLAELAKKI